MLDHNIGQIAIHFAAALGAAAVGGSIAARVRLPAHVGYLAAGVLLGRVFVALGEGGATLIIAADYAVAALLFILALQVPLSALRRRPIVPIGMALQFLGVTFGGVWLASALGADPRSGLVIGAALATSSTIFASEVLGRRANATTRELVLAGSLFQTAIALSAASIAFAPGFAGSTAMIPASVALALLLLAGAVVAFRILRFALERLGDADDDVAQLSVIGVVLLAVGAPAIQIGLPIAFIGLGAGLLVAADERTRAVLRPVVALREVCVALFLVGFGSLLDPLALLPRADAIVALAGAAVVVKLVSGRLVARGAGLPRTQAALGAAALAPMSEMAFVISQEAVAREALDALDQQLLLGAAATGIAVTSMSLPVLAPTVSRVAARRQPVG